MSSLDALVRLIGGPASRCSPVDTSKAFEILRWNAKEVELPFGPSPMRCIVEFDSLPLGQPLPNLESSECAIFPFVWNCHFGPQLRDLFVVRYFPNLSSLPGIIYLSMVPTHFRIPSCKCGCAGTLYDSS